MGHKLARPTAAAAVALALIGAGCGGGDSAEELPPVLDNARALVTTPTTDSADDVSDTVTDETGQSADDDGGDEELVEELPAPDPSTFDGANRVVNLWLAADGATNEIDVWGRRTFTNGPVLLAEAIPFGSASDYFAAPPGYSLVIVGAGAGPDGAELGGLFNAAAGEQATTIFTNDDAAGSVWAPTIWEVGTSDAPEMPEPGTGLVTLRVANTGAYTDQLTATIGGDSFYVGDGTGQCRSQRIEAAGFQANVLGGTQSVELELVPGPVEITLHPWFSPDECDQPSALTITADIEPDTSVMILVFTRDGESVESLVLPVESSSSTP